MLARSGTLMRSGPDEAAEARASKAAALSIVSGAFADAEREGIDSECLAQVAIFTALSELVGAYGEEAVAQFAHGLPDRVRQGGFSLRPKH